MVSVTLLYDLGKMIRSILCVIVMDTLAERLRHARKTAPERGVKSAYGRVTQSDVANIAGVTRQAIVKVEKGLSQSTPQKLFLIADFLKVDPLWLIGGVVAEDDAHKSNESGAVVEGFASLHKPRKKTVSDDERIEQIAAIHALTGQILDNADKGRSNNRILKMLDDAILEYQTFSVEEKQ